MKAASLKFSVKEKPSFYDIKINRKRDINYYNEKGQLHRLDGPAVEKVNGDKEWYINGKRHRLDGPAVEWSNGDKAWYVNNKLHRLDGPAVEWQNGVKKWYVNDKLIGSSKDGFTQAGFTQEDFEQWKKKHGYENS